MSGQRIERPDGPAFRKTAPAASRAMFEAEAEGLVELAAAGAIRVPAVYEVDDDGDIAWIDMEWLALSGDVDHAMLGTQIAQLHRATAERFGWHRDNTIGPTPQVNAYADDWIDFFRERRLRFQFELAAENGYTGELQVLGEKLLRDLGRLFHGYEPVPSLLHGDLWSGNRGSVDGQPVIYDPAVYYGDRETDLAMSRLFGGFDRAFYRAYDREWPLADGHEQRTPLYQLYHVLNHLNLFGSGYLGQALGLLSICTGVRTGT